MAKNRALVDLLRIVSEDGRCKVNQCIQGMSIAGPASPASAPKIVRLNNRSMCCIAAVMAGVVSGLGKDSSVKDVVVGGVGRV